MSRLERRHNRSDDTNIALRYQLEACLSEGDLEAILFADDAGLCVAGAGPAETLDEIAARLPILGRGRNLDRFRGTLVDAERAVSVVIKQFKLGASTLYACAVGRADERGEILVARSIGGASRLLA